MCVWFSAYSVCTRTPKEQYRRQTNSCVCVCVCVCARPLQQREQRKRRRAELAAQQRAAGRNRSGAAAPELPLTGARTDMRTMLRNQAAAITTSPWEILHLAETRTPGRFKVRVHACMHTYCLLCAWAPLLSFLGFLEQYVDTV